DFYYKYPIGTIDQLMDRMNNSFEKLTILKRTLYRYITDMWIFIFTKVQLEPVERNAPDRIKARKQWVKMLKDIGVDYMNNNVFVDESGSNANLKRTQGWALKEEAAKVKVLTARANSISILRAISAKGSFKINLRKPMPSPKKRKPAIKGHDNRSLCQFY
ncbi:hypothetical protein EDC96DRAFT_450912, partial [Choanephora cucurbitarum]